MRTTFMMMTADQIVKYLAYFNEYEHSKYFKFHKLWDIKCKKSFPGNSNDDDLAMTDSGAEESEEGKLDIDDKIKKTFTMIKSAQNEAQNSTGAVMKLIPYVDQSMSTLKLEHEQQPVNNMACDVPEYGSPGLLNVDHDLLNYEEPDFLLEGHGPAGRLLI